MPDFKVPYYFKEVIKYLKEAISLLYNLSITPQFIENVVKPTATTLWTATLSVALRCTAMFLGIPKITYQFLQNVVKPVPTIVSTCVLTLSNDSKPAPTPPAISDLWLESPVTPPPPTYVWATDTLTVDRFSEMTPFIGTMIIGGQAFESPVTPPVSEVVGVTSPSVDRSVTS